MRGSMINILDQVNEAEETQLGKKLKRQKAIKLMVQEKNNRMQENKTKKASRLDLMKKQLRQGYSLHPSEKPTHKTQHSKKKKNVPRTLSAINKEWDAMDSSEDSQSVATSEPIDGLASPKSKKTVTFAV
ncbi:hypothetical protein IW138_004754 [Coemansia sp. RSA 986]|nr:hypothetical protein IW138_004754 [Coemansia sp. RSA 986]